MKKVEFINEVKNQSVSELNDRARSMAEELMRLRFKKATNQVEQSHRIKELRRNIARVQTFIARAGKSNSERVS